MTSLISLETAFVAVGGFLGSYFVPFWWVVLGQASFLLNLFWSYRGSSCFVIFVLTLPMMLLWRVVRGTRDVAHGVWTVWREPFRVAYWPDVLSALFPAFFGLWGLLPSLAFGLYWRLLLCLAVVSGPWLSLTVWVLGTVFGLFWVVVLLLVMRVIFTWRSVLKGALRRSSLLLSLGLVLVRVLAHVLNFLAWPVSRVPGLERLAWWLLRDDLSWESLPPSSILDLPDAVREDVRGVAAKSVTGRLATGRLRRRARWVCALQEEFGGRVGVVSAVLGRRWVPDLPTRRLSDVANYVLASVQNGASVLGGGHEKISDGDERDGVYFIVETAESQELVFPALLGSLRQYALFRERNSSLVFGLRSRASEWCRARGLRPWVADLAACSAVSLACMPSTHEVSSRPLVESAIRASTPLSESC